MATTKAILLVPRRGPSEFEWLARNPTGAAGLSLLIGFVGSVVGLVYGWSYTFDKLWFLLWLIIALYFGFRICKKWIVSNWEIRPDRGGSQSLPESRTLEKSNASTEDGHADIVTHNENRG